MDTGNDGGKHTFETGQSLAKGFMVFIRKLANRIIELEKENAELQSFLGSIPEWTEFVENDLKMINNIENRPLCNDPRAKNYYGNNDEDFFDFNLNKPTIGQKFGKENSDNKDDDGNEDATEKVQNNDLFNFSDKNENLDE